MFAMNNVLLSGFGWLYIYSTTLNIGNNFM